MPRVGAFAFVLTVVAFSTAPAHATFSYPDFSSLTNLQLNGSAAQVGNVLRLTPSSAFVGGSVFTTLSTPLGAGNAFSTYFQFRIDAGNGIGDSDGIGADGLVFVIQTVSNNVGGAGGGIGYQGLAPSVGIEFDTYNNGGTDPNGNHVGYDQNGVFTSNTVIEPVRFNSGQIWNAWVDYDGTTNILEARWSLTNLRPLVAQLTQSVNLVTVLGQTSAFVGFTAATGSGYNNHDLLSWEFRDSFDPIDPAPSVPEPASVLLWGVGLALAAGRRFRRSK